MDLESIRSLPCAILYMYDGVLGLFHPISLKRFTGATRAEDNAGLAVTCKGSSILAVMTSFYQLRNCMQKSKLSSEVTIALISGENA